MACHSLNWEGRAVRIRSWQHDSIMHTYLQHSNTAQQGTQPHQCHTLPSTCHALKQRTWLDQSCTILIT
jgi:hypothetical protein